MKIASFFAGEGGFDIAADIMGWETSLICEKDVYCKYLLKKKWPNADYYDDITEANFSLYRRSIDLVVGGFPCQPFSIAGKQQGTNDPRHLWPNLYKAIIQIKPTWFLGENVFGLANWSNGLVLNQIKTDLEKEGYCVQCFIIPACGVEAPHIRYRVFIVAYSGSNGLEYGIYRQNNPKEGEGKSERDKWERVWNYFSRNGSKRVATNATRKGLEKSIKAGFEKNKGQEYTEAFNEFKRFSEHGILTNWKNFPTQSPVCSGDDGIPSELVRRYVVEHSGGILTEKEIDKIVSKTIAKFRKIALSQHGNSVVPQLVLQFYKAIEMYENL